MTLKKNGLILVPKCPCEECSGNADSRSNCVSDAIGVAHIVKTLRKDGQLKTKCGLLARNNEVVAQKKHTKDVCKACEDGVVIWHQPNSPESRHDDLVEGIESLHKLVGGLIAFVTAHAHQNSEDGCKVCEEMKKKFEDHQKGCPDCHE